MKVTISTTCFSGRPTGQENIAMAAQLLDEAGQRRSDIVCLPESFTHRREAVIETLDGPAIAMATDRARVHRMYVIAPIIERCGEQLYNSSVLIDRQGDVVGVYRKVYPTEGELNNGIVPGDSLPVFETDFGPIAILTCYDHDWPELFGAYRRLGARIVFWPTMAYGYAEFDHLVLKSTICFDYGLYLVAANYYYDSDPAPAQDFRHTYILSPEGVPLADTSYRPGLLTAHVDLDFQWPARDHSAAAHAPWTELLEPYRRVDLYTPLSEPARFLNGTSDNGAPPPASSHLAEVPTTGAVSVTARSDAPGQEVQIAALNLPLSDANAPHLALDLIDSMLAETRAQIAVLPENCLYGGAAEEIDTPLIIASGADIATLAACARRHHLYLAASCYTEEAGRRHATVFLFDDQGDLVGRYYKTHLSRLEHEQHGIHAGDALPVFATPWGKLGLLLGRDIFYPEAYAVLALQGADLVLWGGSPYPFYPNGWQMRHLLMARPVTYGNCLAAALYSPPPPHNSHHLQRSASIVDQYAHVRSESGAMPGIATAKLRLPPAPIKPIQHLRVRIQERPQLAAAAWR